MIDFRFMQTGSQPGKSRHHLPTICYRSIAKLIKFSPIRTLKAYEIRITYQSARPFFHIGHRTGSFKTFLQKDIGIDKGALPLRHSEKGIDYAIKNEGT